MEYFPLPSLLTKPPACKELSRREMPDLDRLRLSAITAGVNTIPDVNRSSKISLSIFVTHSYSSGSSSSQANSASERSGVPSSSICSYPSGGTGLSSSLMFVKYYACFLVVLQKGTPSGGNQLVIIFKLLPLIVRGGDYQLVPDDSGRLVKKGRAGTRPHGGSRDSNARNHIGAYRPQTVRCNAE